MAAVLVTVLGLVTVTLQQAVASDAVVSSKPAPVFESAASTSAVVAILDPGERVAVRFSIGTSPAWCRIDASHRAITGYTPCEYIQLHTRAVSSWRPPSEASEKRSVPPRVGEPPPNVAMEVMMNKYNAAFWARWLHFNEKQILLMRTLAERTGVSDCRARIVAWHRRHGFDDRSQRDPAENFKRAIRELPSVARGIRCDVAGFWREFPKIMTSEQRQEFEAWQRQRDIPILTRSPLDPALEWFD